MLWLRFLILILPAMATAMPVDVRASEEIPTLEIATNWQEHSFKGHTAYSIKSTNGLETITASCADTASALYQEKIIDLSKTPILRWSWTVGGVHTQLNERTRSGDDYPARVYVVYTPNSLMPWRTLAINYVWSNNQKIGAVWPNVFTQNAVMIALQSGETDSGQKWKQESRNVREDFKTYFDIDLDSIDGIAIMTDCDNAGYAMTSFYKDIYFSKE